jgi:hypothetical protein
VVHIKAAILSKILSAIETKFPVSLEKSKIVFIAFSHRHHSVPPPHRRLANTDRYSTLFLDLMVFTAKVSPVHLLMLSVHFSLCLCHVYLESFLLICLFFNAVVPFYVAKKLHLLFADSVK